MKRCTLIFFFSMMIVTCAFSEDLPSWALGGFTRLSQAPALGPNADLIFDCPMRKEKVKWAESDIFNPACVVKDGKIHVLFRAEDNSAVGIGKRCSRIGLAVTSDGLHMKVRPTPVLFPAQDSAKKFEWPGGCEDPRVAVSPEGLYVMTYTSWNRQVPRLSIATSRDLIHWTKHGPAFADAYGGKFKDLRCKSGSIVTALKKDKLQIEKINGKYFMYWGETAVYAATSDDLIHWDPVLDKTGELRILIEPRNGYFDSQLTECGPPALMTNAGILLIYNGKNHKDPSKADPSLPRGTYSGGQVLFDQKDVFKPIARLNRPFFVPEAAFEKSGQYTDGTVFLEGLAYYQKKWYLYYGCADSKVGVASSSAGLLTDTTHTPLLSSYVDPFIGTTGKGNIFLGACVPNGMVKVGPDVNKKNMNSGWEETGNIHGISHIHVSGTGGGPKYGNILFAPVVGDIHLEDYSSPRANEFAEVGEYRVDFERYHTNVRATALARAALHEYTFPESKSAKILIDLGSFLSTLTQKSISETEQQSLVGSEINILSDTEIEGYQRVRGGWNKGKAYTVYFYAQFDTPAKDVGTWKKPEGIHPGQRSEFDSNSACGAYFNFETQNNQRIRVRVGISYLSSLKAKENLKEINDWNFEQTKLRCCSKWDSLFQKVALKATQYQKKLFYTALYHVYMQPTDKTGENSLWKSDAPYYDDYFAIWDTYRATHPLITLLTPSTQTKMLNTLLDIYQYEGYMPDARSGDCTGRTQGGSDCDILFADAFVKGLQGINYPLALESMIKNAEVPPGGNEQKEGRGGIADYNQKGYISSRFPRAGSRQMEYANCDYALYTLAKGLGKSAIAEKYLKRSQNWRNLWNDQIESLGFHGFIWSRNEKGEWIPEKEYSLFQSGSWNDFFYETFSWELSLFVPHDMPGLIEQCGGKDTFIKRLDTYFTHEYPKDLFPQYAQRKYLGLFLVSNEPAFMAPCMYNYVNRPDKTAEISRKVLRERYNGSRSGLPGNDDSGSMSAWYIFQSLGFFPNAGQDLYLITSPVMQEATLKFENGHNLIIRAKNASDQNIYIQSASLNGKPLNQCFFRHTDIASGGLLEFVMGPKPSTWAQ